MVRESLTLLQHAGLPALAQTALLTLAPHVHVHLAAACIFASVLCSFDDAASEETFTALTAQHIIMKARCFVSTYATHLIPQHLGSRAFLSLDWLTLCTNTQKINSSKSKASYTNKSWFNTLQPYEWVHLCSLNQLGQFIHTYSQSNWQHVHTWEKVTCYVIGKVQFCIIWILFH